MLPFLHFAERRHERHACPNRNVTLDADWRMRERLKTVSVALVLCLNIGIDPPDIVKTVPCAKLECWVDPGSLPPQKALETIGRNLQQQYEVWQPRARYRLSLDPSVEETKKLCTSLRRNAKDERILFHYNGHGVPKPTPGGEIWVFNKNYTQYIPVSIYDIQTWLGAPCIYVFDCSNAGNIVSAFGRFAEQREREAKDGDDAARGGSMLKDCIQLAACMPNETLPMNPDLPADLFSCCLTTPIEIALRWFVSQNPLLGNITADMIMKIPGRLNDRRTPLGELNWIFTAITDTIAWNVLPHTLFKRLFRQDLMVAALFRNFLLAERIMRYYHCTPLSHPILPSTHQHPMWAAWDLAAELCVSQLPGLLKSTDAGMPTEYKHSNFFSEQLTAFEIWLSKGAISKSRPEQLPIVLQVLLSQVHRLRALMLLSRFLDLGPWSVNLALSVGIFPYVLKLLQSPAAELKPVLVFIWAKILAVDRSCQNDLLKDNGYTYFINILSATSNTANIPNISEHRAMCAFILGVFCDNCPPAQEACMKNDLVPALVLHLDDQDPLLRQWACLGLAKLWENFHEARSACIFDQVHEKVAVLLSDPNPEVRASAVFAIGALFGGSSEGSDALALVEIQVGTALLLGLSDASPIVRKELVITLSRIVNQYKSQFVTALLDVLRADATQVKGASVPFLRTLWESLSSTSFKAESLRIAKSMIPCILKAIISLCGDPFPEVSALSLSLLENISTHTVVQSGEAMPDAVRSEWIHGLQKLVVPEPRALATIQKSEPMRRSVSFANALRSVAGFQSTKIFGHGLSTIEPRTSAVGAPFQHIHSANNQISQEPDSYGNVEEDFSAESLTLKSVFFDWSLEYFTEPQMKVPEADDPGSIRFNERMWRSQRNDLSQGQWNERHKLIHTSKFETQLRVMNSNDRPGALLRCHSFEPHIAGADAEDNVIVYDWKSGSRLNWFSNSNPSGTGVTSLHFINEDELALLMVGSSDGVLKLYRKYDRGSTIEVVSAWRCLRPDDSSSSLLVDWLQVSGSVVTASDSSIVRVWDVERELCAQEFSRTNGATAACLLVTEKAEGNVLVIGGSDGKLELYDKRIAGPSCLFRSYSQSGAILGASFQAHDSNYLISGSRTGEVAIWDVRQQSTLRLMACTPPNVEMTAFSIHSQASIFATGTNSENISVYNFDGINLSTIRNYDGFLGQRIGHVGCLAFHPIQHLLVAGTTANASLAIFVGDTYRG